MPRTQYHAIYSQALREAIELRCISVAKIHRRMGVHESLFYRWLNGKSYPTRKRHDLLCSLLFVDLPFFPPRVRNARSSPPLGVTRSEKKITADKNKGIGNQ